MKDFDLANRAFDLMTTHQRLRVLTKFARLRYPSIADRFVGAVHEVIEEDEG